MRDFTAQRSSVLLCSTIIETGIDIPTANTIVINRADRFGLANCINCADGQGARTTRRMPTSSPRPKTRSARRRRSGSRRSS